MLTLILLSSCVLCFLAYRFYGGFLVKHCRLDDSVETPACTVSDGVDYVPTRASVLFGHHFSSIAGAGPIVGPILAATLFGWGPTWLWILVGAIFVGGVHDFGSTLMSIRFGGRSIAETTRNLVGPVTAKLFIVFVVMALVYVIVVFLDLTAANFVAKREVATASGWFVMVALAFGFTALRTKLPLAMTVAIFVPLTFAGLAVGHFFPAPELSKNLWLGLVLVYCFVAAILPVNILLQPRDFLSATFLYAMMGFGLVGLVFTNAPMQIEFFKGFRAENGAYLVPFLFITVACGACSGFHSIVASGTTSKQIRVETDVRRIGYGAMLVEGVLAVFAMACVAVLTKEQATGSVTEMFARGSGVFTSAVGIPVKLGEEFALLAISTFLLTTLDTCTRLTRFMVEELFNWRNAWSRFAGTAGVLVLPAIFAFQTFGGQPAWKVIWPLFGSTNQLLAALALVTFVAFLRSRRIGYLFALIPAILMVIMPLVSLVMMTVKNGVFSLLGSISIIMFILGLFVVIMSGLYVFGPARREKPGGAETENA